MLKPHSGNCCVFCSYGSVKCNGEQNRRKWLVIISICLIGFQIGLLGGKTICGCDVEFECIASDSENIAPSRGEVVIRELA